MGHAGKTVARAVKGKGKNEKTAEVEIAETQYGTPTAMLWLGGPINGPRMGARAENAEIYRVAAEVEIASEGMKWAVCVDTNSNVIHIEDVKHDADNVAAHVDALCEALDAAGYRIIGNE